MTTTRPDVYQQSALRTRKRNAPARKAGRELQAQLNAYQKASVEARKSGAAMPVLADYVSK